MNWRLKLLDLIRGLNQEKLYTEMLKSQYEGTPESIQKYMDDRQREIFNFHVKNNPKYCDLLASKGFDYSRENIDLKTIPIINKDDLRKFNPVLETELYSWSKSSGSTGQPFKYSLNRKVHGLTWASNWVAHNVLDIEPCDKMFMMLSNTHLKQDFKHKVMYFLSNFYLIKSKGLTDDYYKKIYNLINIKNINLIYGYSNNAYQFVNYLKNNNLKINLKGIFTTSENFIPAIIPIAKEVCNCDVIDLYGARDGGMFSHTCKENSGLHILHFNCTVEIIDSKIILTDTSNTSYPFIRYEVGDYCKGDLITEKCKCGRTTFRIKGLDGRVPHHLKDKDGNIFKINICNYILKDDSIDQYQAIHIKDKLVINIISKTQNLDFFNSNYLDKFKQYTSYPIEFKLNKPLEKALNGKTPMFIDKTKS